MSRLTRSRTTSAAASSLAAARTRPVIRAVPSGVCSSETTNPASRAPIVAGSPARITGSTSAGSNGSLHDLGEQPLLGAEEMADQGRVDAGLQRDRPQRRAVEALRGELLAGRGPDRLAGPAVPRAAAGPGPAAGLFRHGTHRTR